MNPWQVLGIARTTDQRAIKTAYARLLKVHRPDTDPAGYQQLRSAFDAAIAEARRGDGGATRARPVAARDSEPPADASPEHRPVREQAGVDPFDDPAFRLPVQPPEAGEAPRNDPARNDSTAETDSAPGHAEDPFAPAEPVIFGPGPPDGSQTPETFSPPHLRVPSSWTAGAAESTADDPERQQVLGATLAMALLNVAMEDDAGAAETAAAQLAGDDRLVNLDARAAFEQTLARELSRLSAPTFPLAFVDVLEDAFSWQQIGRAGTDLADAVALIEERRVAYQFVETLRASADRLRWWKLGDAEAVAATVVLHPERTALARYAMFRGHLADHIERLVEHVTNQVPLATHLYLDTAHIVALAQRLEKPRLTLGRLVLALIAGALSGSVGVLLLAEAQLGEPEGLLPKVGADRFGLAATLASIVASLFWIVAVAWMPTLWRRFRTRWGTSLRWSYLRLKTHFAVRASVLGVLSIGLLASGLFPEDLATLALLVGLVLFVWTDPEPFLGACVSAFCGLLAVSLTGQSVAEAISGERVTPVPLLFAWLWAHAGFVHVARERLLLARPGTSAMGLFFVHIAAMVAAGALLGLGSGAFAMVTSE